ncbi:MAG TPA: formylglycine-generating enzyme family protein [Candidatus Eremiobacteraeota bacterium]|nr:MAG: Serine/threonine-protein kinase pkn1 [bacterium ADurb.Bin363]HPZ06732.1 formylglycine-generating enzyme family protein [Candidatus Eremiobacteraeota bacterium]
MKEINLFTIISVFTLISLFFFTGCGDDGRTTFTDIIGPEDPQITGPEGPDMVLIHSGAFLMGDIQGVGLSRERPVHKVTLTKDFYMSKYEVTNGEYVRFLNAQSKIEENWIHIKNDEWCGLTGNKSNPSGIQVKKNPEDYTNRPVVYVSWYGAAAYCKWLSKEEGYDYGTGKGYRLPTEAEWEYACRGGTATSYYWGNELDATIGTGKCWYDYYNSGTCNTKNHTNVGYGGSHPYGLYDMSGNVSEWCSDCYDENYYSNPGAGGPDPTGPSPKEDSYYILRGGSWYSYSSGCRSAFRNYLYPDSRGNYCGFRVVRSVP